MTEQTRKYIEQSLEEVNQKIEKKEDRVQGGLYMFGVGLAGMAYGVLTKSDSSLMSGMIVGSGSLLFRMINKMFLDKLRFKQYAYRYALKHDNMNEYHFESSEETQYKGKHFKR